jgi:hypothetical protein
VELLVTSGKFIYGTLSCIAGYNLSKKYCHIEDLNMIKPAFFTTVLILTGSKKVMCDNLFSCTMQLMNEGFYICSKTNIWSDLPT